MSLVDSRNRREVEEEEHLDEIRRNGLEQRKKFLDEAVLLLLLRSIARNRE